MLHVLQQLWLYDSTVPQLALFFRRVDSELSKYLLCLWQKLRKLLCGFGSGVDCEVLEALSDSVEVNFRVVDLAQGILRVTGAAAPLLTFYLVGRG